MKKSLIIPMVLISIAVIAFSGCIERSVTASETILVKIDSSGHELWRCAISNQAYSKSIYEFTNTMALTPDNGVLIAGTYTNASARENLRLIKIDSDGKIIFDRSCAGANWEILGVVNRPEGGYLVIARDGTLYRIDSDGNPTKTQKIQGPAGGQQSSGVWLGAFTTTSTGQLFVAGNPDISPGDLVLFELSTDGKVRNTIKHTEERGSLICSAITANNDSIVFGGMRYNPPSFPDTGKPWVAAFNRNGTTSWERIPGTCPGNVASVVEVPGTGWDSVIRTTGCDKDRNNTTVFRDILFDQNGQIANEYDLTFPHDPVFSDSLDFIIPPDYSATMKNTSGAADWNFIFTRFARQSDWSTGLIIGKAGGAGTINWSTNTSWSSWSGEQANEIDAVASTGEGSVIILGKSYRW